jgi:hypothetical protein
VKRISFLLATVLFFLPAALRADRVHVQREGGNRSNDHAVRERPRFDTTNRGGGGRFNRERAVTSPPGDHTVIVRNTAIVNHINQQRRVEVVPNRTYWHREGRSRYAHTYDHGLHWYGFYDGPSFYWTCLYGDRWWWYDVNLGRWDFWRDGYWWWPAPGGVIYVYRNDNYYPYEESGLSVGKPEPSAPPVTAPSAGTGTTVKSPDKRRMVQIYGEEFEAFLYDTTGVKPVYLKHLGQSVDRARFLGGVDSKPLQVLLDYKDGAFALFSENGDPLETGAAADKPSSTTPPSEPGAKPPESPPTAPPTVK